MFCIFLIIKKKKDNFLQGNAETLIHTPLTDKCYLTLTQG